ncbi:MAG: hypothetical protein ACK2UW_20565, partial [Anaerolineales bacterium]
MNAIFNKHWMQATFSRRVRLLTAAGLLLSIMMLLSACGGSAPTAALQATGVPSLAATASPTSPESTQIETATQPEVAT